MRTSIIKDDYVEWVSPKDPDFDPSIENQTRLVIRRFEVSTFIDRDYYVQTISDDDETVLAFSVTTRSARFRPVYEAHRRLGLLERWRWQRRWGEQYRPVVHLKLGKSTFADVVEEPSALFGWAFRIQIGAHNHAYSERTYLGNPGNYQTFVWTASDAARHGKFAFNRAVRQEIGSDEWPAPATESLPWETLAETKRFREETVITTYTVIHPGLALVNYPVERFGPHENDVRLLP